MYKHLKCAFLIGIGLVYGICIGALKFFPYDQIENIYYLARELTNNENPALHGHRKRFIDTSNRQAIKFNPSDRDCIFVVYGQSNAANSGQIGYNVDPGVLQFFEGQVYQYIDPSLGGTDFSGSVWGRVGDSLIRREFCNQVVFGVTAAGDQTILELSNGAQFDFFISTASEMQNLFGQVDGILFHQGESNHSSLLRKLGREGNYRTEFIAFLDLTRAMGVSAPLFLSRASYCGDRDVDEGLQYYQNQIIAQRDDVIAGPNTDTLVDAKYRVPDACHFSSEGFDAFSEMWVTSIMHHKEPNQ